jgi:N-hydroxyarylamine O-acetyltransferase
VSLNSEQARWGPISVQRYLERIRHDGPADPTLRTLRALHRAHLLAVPFENLDIHRGRRIVLDSGALFRKIVEERRGGFCYELNGLFASLLEALGFRVTLLSARVRDAEEGFSPEFDHLTLRIDLDEPWLADVGFGEGFREPLRLAERGVQTQGSGEYRLSAERGQWAYSSRTESGEWEVEYLFTLQPRRYEEFAAMCDYHQTSPQSPFTRKRFCTLPTAVGRVTLRDDRLILTRNGTREELPISGEAEFNAMLRRYFAIQLPS